MSMQENVLKTVGGIDTTRYLWRMFGLSMGVIRDILQTKYSVMSLVVSCASVFWVCGTPGYGH